MLLSIARKAVTEEDAAKILADTFAIPRPFGVPTLVLRQENLPDKMTVEKNTSKRTALLRALNPFVKFYSDAELPADADGTLLRILFKRALEQHGMDAHATDTLDRILSGQKSLCKFLKTGLASNFNALCLPYPHRKFPSHAHHYAKDYKEPLFSIVIAPRNTADGQKMMKEICGNLAQPRNPLPGYASQWQTFILWHEYAHGCGADETQADTMAAIICRKAFADQRFMTAWADIRAFDVIQKSADEEAAQSNRYPWSIVEALDAVAAMDQLDIDVMQEEDVKKFRFQRHTPDIRAISNVAFAVKAELHSLPNWTNGYFRAALSLINRGAFPRPAERGIATRFLLAAARLSRGGSMYNEKTDSFDFKPSQKPAFPI